MTVKEQLLKLKENWLLVLVVLVVLYLMSGSGDFDGAVPSLSSYAPSMAVRSSYEAAPSYARSSLYDRGFAPEVKDRLISKTARLSSEVEKGSFSSAESQLKSIIKSSESYLLNEDVDTYNSGERGEYTSASYEIKVQSAKYDAVVQQLKGIGKVLSFNENAEDITGTYINIKVELDTERKRLLRYEQMYAEAKKMEDKIDLNDRMFNQERTIANLLDSMDRLGKQVTYSTIRVSLAEKKSAYADIAFVELSMLAEALIGSLNTFLVLAVAALPWVLGIGLVVWLYRKLFGQKNKVKKA
ncbi:DUF4349 domain-containing protein [Candidatus Woesearchaeota archaeon]|nr:DUF4349 domain-containing protein [Candidatus Woesearchaeota archaeon]